ncbi:hypothetical protein K3217_01240 [bacterium BD-1]|nr:hypothetical protein [Ottowia caeni]
MRRHRERPPRDFRSEHLQRGGYRQPPLLSRLRHRLYAFCPFNPYRSFPMSHSRRNILVRSMAVLAGDVATGVALATACVWMIEAAALGLFLSFLVWLLGLALSLALSQYLVHPAVRLVLSDRKLDGAVFAVQSLARRAHAWVKPLMPV